MSEAPAPRGLSLAPLRALRYTATDPQALGALLCPPYDVIDDAARAALLAGDPNNAVRIVLPRAGGGSADGSDGPGPQDDNHAYQQAAYQLEAWLAEGVVAVDDVPALYIYEMRSPRSDGAPDAVTRGLVGAVELRDPDDGVILPHENTMAGPVADRLALMSATDANLEPIYLVYDGGGAASELVASVGPAPASTPETGYTSRHRADTGDDAADDDVPPLATATTPDGVQHRLWAVTDPDILDEVAHDLLSRRALIADGHHRYATYRQLAAERTAQHGPGPWDRGLALLVDSSTYGPEVHPIHRVVPGLAFADAIANAAGTFTVDIAATVDDGLAQLAKSDTDGSGQPGFAVVVTDGTYVAVISAPDPRALAAARTPGEPEALLELDVSVLHRLLIERSWRVTDDEHHVYYAHDVDEAVAKAKAASGVAVLLRATPVDSVAAVAAAGARMPRKSTFFTPKPASGLVMRRFADQTTG